MTDDLTTLSTREMDRLQVVLRIADRRLTQTAGAQILGISDRQMRRIYRRFAQEGAAGLGSKRRGKSNRRSPLFRERKNCADLKQQQELSPNGRLDPPYSLEATL